MHFIKSEELHPGDRLAIPIYDLNGGILLNSDMSITNKDISQIVERGFKQVCILEENAVNIESSNISMETRIQSIQALREMNFDNCIVMSNRIASELIIGNKGFISSDLMGLCQFDSYTFNHSVNVAVYAAALGIQLKLQPDEIYNLAITGLLHDIGKQFVPVKILFKKGKFTDEEKTLVQKHPTIGYNILKENPNLHKSIKMGVLTHHENYDGSGYPLNLAGNKIPLYGRILHIVDVFDALLADRSYKTAESCCNALDYISKMKNKMFDPIITNKFISNIAMVSIGDEYKLDDGTVCYVQSVQSAHIFTVINSKTGETMEVNI